MIEFEIKQIIDMQVRSNQIRYLIDWKSTWVASDKMKLYEQYPYSIISEKEVNTKTYLLIEWKPTWVVAEHVSHDAIAEYQIEQRNKRITKRQTNSDEN